MITTASKRLLIIEADGLALQVNRKNGQVTAQKRNKYYSLNCTNCVYAVTGMTIFSCSAQNETGLSPQLPLSAGLLTA